MADAHMFLPPSLQHGSAVHGRPIPVRLVPAALFLLGALGLSVLPVAAQPAQTAPAPVAPQFGPEPSWTDWADLALSSPVVLRVEVARVDRLSKREAPDVPAGEVRAIVRAGLKAAIRAPGVLPAEAAWRWQGPADSRGRVPIPKGAPLLLFAEPLGGGGDPAVQPLKLVEPGGQQPWSAQGEAIVRDVLKQALSRTARVMLVTGVKDAFRSEGDVAGASESQFFLEATDGRPLTLLVLRKPGAEPMVRVATGDLVDRAQPVAPRTLLWRGLACGMPDRLPDALAANPGLADDYALARADIGACGRRLGVPGK
jgi:hypothetical protein